MAVSHNRNRPRFSRLCSISIALKCLTVFSVPAFKYLRYLVFLKINFLVFVFSLVVGLDDIMDEGVVKESGNDTIDEEELILPNRNLRDKVEENSVRSPRKSPRLMAQGNLPERLS